MSNARTGNKLFTVYCLLYFRVWDTFLSLADTLKSMQHLRFTFKDIYSSHSVLCHNQCSNNVVQLQSCHRFKQILIAQHSLTPITYVYRRIHCWQTAPLINLSTYLPTQLLDELGRLHIFYSHIVFPNCTVLFFCKCIWFWTHLVL